MASGWSHKGLFHCRHCNLAVRLSLHVKIMPVPLLILIVANDYCLFIKVIVYTTVCLHLFSQIPVELFSKIQKAYEGMVFMHYSFLFLFTPPIV